MHRFSIWALVSPSGLGFPKHWFVGCCTLLRAWMKKVRPIPSLSWLVTGSQGAMALGTELPWQVLWFLRLFGSPIWSWKPQQGESWCYLCTGGSPACSTWGHVSRDTSSQPCLCLLARGELFQDHRCGLCFCGCSLCFMGAKQVGELDNCHSAERHLKKAAWQPWVMFYCLRIRVPGKQFSIVSSQALWRWWCYLISQAPFHLAPALCFPISSLGCDSTWLRQSV